VSDLPSVPYAPPTRAANPTTPGDTHSGACRDVHEGVERIGLGVPVLRLRSKSPTAVVRLTTTRAGLAGRDATIAARLSHGGVPSKGMAPIPVVCQGCGRLFVTTNLIGGNATVSFVDVGVGPCPFCGGMGRIRDGVYQITENVVRWLSGPDVTVSDLRRLQGILAEAKRNDRPSEQVVQDIAKTVPAASGLPSLLSNRGAALAQWLSVILALIGPFALKWGP
jgi:hypothetical protein